MKSKIHYQQPDFYHFSESSISLAKYAARNIIACNRILDLFSGCGVIGRVFLEGTEDSCDLVVIEKQKEFLPSLEANFGGIDAEIVIGDFRAHCFDKFDLILANPPFYSKDNVRPSPHENKNQCQIRDFTWEEMISWALEQLKPKGHFIFLAPVVEENQVVKGLKKLSVEYKKKSLNAKEFLIHVSLNKK